ncbi:MAG TPA: hypothetical protein VMJ32_08585 [Pirellulales bacterium]|nr:hypothetical protein [Pirellulales bacterium]
MPTITQLRKARKEFNRIEPRDFFYWSVTKLVTAVLEDKTGKKKVDELVRALMMLLMTWNKNYYRFHGPKGKQTLEEHFIELEIVISKHLVQLLVYRNCIIEDVSELPSLKIQELFQDFEKVLGRVGAAKCLHLIAPRFFPLWDAAILKGYGMEKGQYRNRLDCERYVAFMAISQAQIVRLGNISSFADNPLKSLDEYNYCCFTKKVSFK